MSERNEAREIASRQELSLADSIYGLHVTRLNKKKNGGARKTSTTVTTEEIYVRCVTKRKKISVLSVSNEVVAPAKVKRGCACRTDNLILSDNTRLIYW